MGRTLLAVLAVLWASQVGAQYGALFGGGLQTQTGPRFALEYARPEVHRWYGPRHLLETYMQPWYASDARYALDGYSRYVDALLEGGQFYDSFGTSIGRGWQVYSWSQTQPGSQGSEILKRPRSPEQRETYESFFNRLVIATDGSARDTYRLMIGDEIYTAFTPLTFYKPRFNGMRLDYANDRVRSSLLLSRPSEPNRGGRTDNTNLVGGHAQFTASDFATVGLTYVNGHNARTKAEFTRGNPLRGILTTQQNQALKDLWVRVRDDSPADERGGAAVFFFDIVLVDTSGRQVRGSEIGFLPEVEGGQVVGSTLIANGSEQIVYHYRLSELDHGGLRSVDLQRVAVELSLANDYRVEMASDLQVDEQGRTPSPVFLPFARAAGNVRDRSNGRILRLDYALPTANEIWGVDWEVRDWHGLSLLGELALNRRYGQYPSPNIRRGHEAATTAEAMYATALYQRYPWDFFVEAFSISDEYTTRYWLTQASGQIFFDARVPQLYEFVDDDDDLDALPDWERPFQPWNPAVWPAYDENRDFVYDHNQNRNLVPDYAEPFLRYRADRPEFFFGMDMNHNGVVDRFENDERADYPYRSDHRGYNAYVRVHAGPDMSLSAGRQSMELVSGDGRTLSHYWLATWERLWGGGRLRFFEHGALVEDNIPDDLMLWVQPVGVAGRMRAFADPLPARDTWKNSLYADADHRLGPDLRLLHRFKWDLAYQRDPEVLVRQREGRKVSSFVGLIDKVEWSIPVGLGVFEPRFKSEYRRERPFSTRQSSSTLVEETLFLIWTQPLLAESVGVSYFPRYGRQLFSTELQVGLELSWLELLEGRTGEIEEDFRSWTGVAQLSNSVGYLGYNVATRIGLRVGRRHFESGRTQRTSLFFMSIHAGL